MATYVPPKRATAYRMTLSLFARSDNQIKTAPTLAAGDVKVSKDNGATANITTLPAETPASSGILQVDLSATEMTADLVTVIFRDAAGAEWNDVAVHIATAARQIDDLAFPNTSGRGMDVDASGGVEVGSFQAGAITAAAIATDAIDADAISADAVTEIQAGLATAAALATVDDFLDTEIAAIKAKTDLIPAAPAAVGDIPTAAAVADAVWDEAIAGHLAAGSTGLALNSAGAAGDPWSTALPGAYGAGTAGKIVGDNIDATISSRLATSGYTAPLDAAGTRTAVGLASANLDTQLDALPTNAELAAADDATLAAIAALNNISQADVRAAVGLASANLDTQLDALPTNAELATALGTADDAVLAQVALVKAKTDLIPASPAATGDIPTADITAIKAKTDSLAFTVAGQVDSNVQYVNDVQVNGTGAAGNEWGP